MCGICGRLDLGAGRDDRAAVEAMTASITHRGPDDEGTYFDREVGLGFRRLSIIDLEHGHQPMRDEATDTTLVFNGEIYNFPELRDELVRGGHRFRTRSDTEVILRGFLEWGDGVLERLNGMFGLAIWDGRRRRLLLARDPMGIKPLYWAVAGDALWFGSEVRALVAGGAVRPGVDREAARQFLRYRYVPAPRTIFAGVSKLAAGTRMVVEDGRIEVARYVDDVPAPFDEMPSADEALDELDELYRAAIRRQQISDVPIGLLLSGGLDSGLLLAMMSEGGAVHRTYSVGYGTDDVDDELSEAAGTAALFGACHTQVDLDLGAFGETLPRALEVVEEPVTSSSIVPMYHVSERAVRDVKVALMGQGPDEMFGGYTRHLGVRYGTWWRRVPGPVRRSLASHRSPLRRHEAVRRAVHSLDQPDRLARYDAVFALMAESELDALFRFPSELDQPEDVWADLADTVERTDELGGFQQLELRSSLPDELLMYGDKLSMAHGLEVRVPYLDLEVVRFVGRLTESYKVHRGSTKWLHRRLCERHLPPEVMRRRKRGFAVKAIRQWFADGLEESGRDVLLDPRSSIYDLIHQEPVLELLAEHEAGRADHHKTLFSLVVLERWFDSFVPA